MKSVRTLLGVGMAALLLTALPTTASAADKSDDATGSPLRSVQVTESQHSEIRTVVAGESARTQKSATSSVTHFFTPQSPAYRGDSAYSHFTGQIHYGGSHMTFAWSNKLHASVAAKATGPMSESATATKNGRGFGYRDSHPSLPATYLVHSSFRVETRHYVLTVEQQYPIVGGKKLVTTVFDFTVTLI